MNAKILIILAVALGAMACVSDNYRAQDTPAGPVQSLANEDENTEERDTDTHTTITLIGEQVRVVDIPPNATEEEIDDAVRGLFGMPSRAQAEAVSEYVTAEELPEVLNGMPIFCGIVSTPRTPAFIDIEATLWDGALYDQYVAPMIGINYLTCDDGGSGVTLTSLKALDDGRYQIIYFRSDDLVPSYYFVEDLSRYKDGWGSTAPDLCPVTPGLPPEVVPFDNNFEDSL